MGRSRRDYDEIYRETTWAYSDKPDAELIKALTGEPRGKAVDLGGGQGRHALALTALGYEVTLVDSVAEGLHQAVAAGEERGLQIDVAHSDAAGYVPESDLVLVVAALLFHLPAHRKSLQIASRLGDALRPGGLLYISVPGFNDETKDLVPALLHAAGCRQEWLVNHLVTKEDRPRLQVPRRNEARALGRKPR